MKNIKLLNSRTVYMGRIFDVRIDGLRENDTEYDREMVIHRGSAVIVPLFSDNTVALVRQYRHAAGKDLFELPAGTLEPGEEPIAGAIRELEEEIGVRTAKIAKLSEFYVSPGFLTEKMYLFLASELTEVGQKLESDELLEVERLPIEKLYTMVCSGEIEDAKTIIGILLTYGHCHK
ncbi:MAG: NUDIX hydrolase [Pyrinomonadaceae bacterium]